MRIRILSFLVLALTALSTAHGSEVDSPFTWEEVHQIMMCQGTLQCVGYSGYGGPCYDGYGGPLYDGHGGACYDGYGGPLYDGYGGRLYDGYGGNCYDGYGGPCYDGYGGNCYDGYGGTGENCPLQCYTVCDPESKRN